MSSSVSLPGSLLEDNGDGNDSMDVHPSSTPNTRFARRTHRSLLTPGGRGGEEGVVGPIGLTLTPPTVARSHGTLSKSLKGLNRLSAPHRTNEWYHDAIAQCHDQLASLNGQARELRESLNESSRQSLVRSSAASLLSVDDAEDNNEGGSTFVYPEMLSPDDTMKLVGSVMRRSYSEVDSEEEEEDEDEEYLKDLSMEVEGQSEQNQSSNRLRYINMDVPSTALRSSQLLMRSSIDLSP